jgi:hypothetical protein
MAQFKRLFALFQTFEIAKTNVWIFRNYRARSLKALTFAKHDDTLEPT